MPATFHFYIREDRPDKRKFCPVYLRITFNRKKKYLNTGIKLPPSDWNPDRQEVRKTYGTKKEVHDLNIELKKIRTKAEEAYRELYHDKRASADAIKKRLEYSSKDNFFDLADEYLDELKPESFYNWKQSTVAINKLRDFHGSNHLPVNSIDGELLNNFVKYMQRELKNQPSTIEKNFNPIRNILDIALSRELIPMNPAKGEGFSLPKKNGSNSKAKLSYDQIQTIENLKLKKGSQLWHSRNTFILSFYFCGIRFGDLATLTWENVKNDRLHYVMSKTGTEINVKIPEGAKRYLDHYRTSKNTDYILPYLSGMSKKEQSNSEMLRKKISSANALVNGQESDNKVTGLKEIAVKAGIDETLSMHVARHSFSQYAIEEKEVPVYRMMILLGHQNIKTTMQYLKTINVKAADDAMDAIF